MKSSFVGSSSKFLELSEGPVRTPAYLSDSGTQEAYVQLFHSIDAVIGVRNTELIALQANAQALENIKSQDELNKVVGALDSELFDSYNRCDLDKFSRFFVDDVEFYHDQGGVTLGKAKLLESLKMNICGKVSRELVSSSVQVYPMKGYGAVQMGLHRFHHPGREDTEPVGEAKFIHLWRYNDGEWRITRVISYDHHALAK